MDVRQLRCFDAVLTTGAMTLAAELLGLAQPTVSITIQQLEKEIGFSLFHRSKGRLEPTPEAYWFHQATKEALDGVARVTQTAHEIKRLNQGQVSILCYPAISWQLIPALISDFHHEFPGVQIKLVSRSSVAVRQVALGQSHDIAIMETPVPVMKSDVRIFRYTCQCLVHKDSSFAQRDTLTPADLHEVPFVTLFSDHTTNHQTKTAFAQYGATLNASLECDYFMSAAHFVHGSNAVTVIDPLTAEQLSPSLNVVTRPFRPKIVYEVALIRAVNKTRSKLADEFYKRISKRLDEIESLEGV
jgi:DNA-binding transcriptional LysR family regulator